MGLGSVEEFASLGFQAHCLKERDLSARLVLLGHRALTISNEEEAMAKRVEGKAGKASTDERQLKLLLVDEEVNDLDYYAEILRYLGYAVRPVDSYSRAAALLGRERFDLVIVDQGSTGFEGRSVLIRAVEVDQRVPVLVLTRAVDADCCIEALDSGAYEYVQKPLTTAEVRELISDYLKPQLVTASAGRGYLSHRDSAGADSEEAERDSLRRAS